MPLPADFQTVPVTGKYVLLDGSPATGTVKFTGKTVLTSAGTDTLVIPASITATLDGNGAFAVNLPATDDPDITPANWTYTVAEQFTNGTGRTFDMDVPISMIGTGIDISNVVPAAPADGDPTAFVTLTTFGGLEDRVEDLEAGGPGVSDHGALTGLADDDHPQYHNDTRGDARYKTAPTVTATSTIQGATVSPTGQTLFQVQNSDGTTTYFSITDGAVNFNLPYGVYTFDLTSQRIYNGDTDPDPGAPNGARWLSPTGLKIRTAGSWVAAESLSALGVTNRALSASADNATTTPQSITGLALTVGSTGTYRAEFELLVSTTSTIGSALSNIAWTLGGPTVSAVRSVLRKIYAGQGPDATFTPSTGAAAAAFGAIGNTWTTGASIPAATVFRQIVETTFVATATGTLTLSFAPPAGITAPGVQVLSQSVSRLTKIA